MAHQVQDAADSLYLALQGCAKGRAGQRPPGKQLHNSNYQYSNSG